MIVYIELEHFRLRHQSAKLGHRFETRQLQIKHRLEEISNEPCLIVHYTLISPALIHNAGAKAVIISGHNTAYEYYPEETLAGLRAVYREAAWPILGFCAGFQRMAQTYGGQIAPMGSLLVPDLPPPTADVDLSSTSFEQDTQQERGFTPVRILQEHPLLADVGQEAVFFQMHAWEVKSIPEEFEVLAESSVCGIQAIAHKSAPLFGTQFHPEQYDTVHPDGRRVLENFFKIAKITI